MNAMRQVAVQECADAAQPVTAPPAPAARRQRACWECGGECFVRVPGSDQIDACQRCAQIAELEFMRARR